MLAAIVAVAAMGVFAPGSDGMACNDATVTQHCPSVGGDPSAFGRSDAGGPIWFPTVSAARAAASSPSGIPGALEYHGGAIQKFPKTFIVFWGWGGSDPSGEAPYLENFFRGMGGSSWANIVTQYSETNRGFITNPAGQLAGTWNDDSSTPPVTISTSQLEQEALNAEAHFGYDQDANYIVATPTGHSTSGFGSQYCAWHDITADLNGRQVAFTNLPYQTDAGGGCGENFVNQGSAGLLDGVSIVAGHESAETVTDPQLNAWYDGSGYEIGDKCAWISPGSPGGAADITLGGAVFAVQTMWSNADNTCVISYGNNVQAPTLTDFLCSPNPGVVGQAVACEVRATGSSPVFYSLAWGDGTTTFYPSHGTVAPNVTQYVSHTWMTSGAFTAKAIAADSGGASTAMIMTEYIDYHFAYTASQQLPTSGPIGAGFIKGGQTATISLTDNSDPHVMGAYSFTNASGVRSVPVAFCDGVSVPAPPGSSGIQVWISDASNPAPLVSASCGPLLGIATDGQAVLSVR
ncbi:MAG: hypothetical protein ACYDDF_03825 [Thermoplasmatota archaeon]